MTAFGTRLPTCVLWQVGSYLEYTCSRSCRSRSSRRPPQAGNRRRDCSISPELRMPVSRRAVEAERMAERADRRSAQLTRQIDALRRPTVLRPLNMSASITTFGVKDTGKVSFDG